MDYYRRSIDSCIEIYRARPSQRFIMCTLAGYFPVLQRLPEGTLAAIVRGGDLHVGERGCLGIVTSHDGGESWSRVQIIAADGPDNRNQAFGVTSNGTLVLAYMKGDQYINGEFQWCVPSRPAPAPIYIRRSIDGGVRWSAERREFPIAAANTANPYGKIIELPSGVLLMNVYGTTASMPQGCTWVVRSYDDGLTWTDVSVVATGFSETGLLALPAGRIIAMMRGDLATLEDRVWQAISDDGGYTWSLPTPVTDPGEHPADIIRLLDGRLLATFSHRHPPFGVRALISSDEGKTWKLNERITLAWESRTVDCGYPSSIQRPDGKVVTAYYTYESDGPWAMWLPDRPVGVHAAAVIYDSMHLP